MRWNWFHKVLLRFHLHFKYGKTFGKFYVEMKFMNAFIWTMLFLQVYIYGLVCMCMQSTRPSLLYFLHEKTMFPSHDFFSFFFKFNFELNLFIVQIIIEINRKVFHAFSIKFTSTVCVNNNFSVNFFLSSCESKDSHNK